MHRDQKVLHLSIAALTLSVRAYSPGAMHRDEYVLHLSIAALTLSVRAASGRYAPRQKLLQILPASCYRNFCLVVLICGYQYLNKQQLII